MQINKPVSFYNTDNALRLRPRGRYFTTWNVYPTQSQALDTVNQDQIVLSFQFNAKETGKRKYLVTELRTFYDEYLIMQDRHYYELIHSSCHLYFDIEFELPPSISNGSDIPTDANTLCVERGEEMMLVFKGYIRK